MVNSPFSRIRGVGDEEGSAGFSSSCPQTVLSPGLATLPKRAGQKMRRRPAAPPGAVVHGGPRGRVIRC